MKNKLNLSKSKITRARKLAAAITAPVQKYIKSHSTVSVERATLRVLGCGGIDKGGMPIPNLIAGALGPKLKKGAARYYLNALRQTGKKPAALNKSIAGGLDITTLNMSGDDELQNLGTRVVKDFSKRVKNHVRLRTGLIKQHRQNQNAPLLYLIVATGNIHEDVKQAAAAVSQGADIVAVIRTTAQSLLDYVPHGATTAGFGGTYATRENFRIMRKTLDRAGEKEGRYIRLVNYASGLCMPEIAVMGALERLDMMLNDSMYGVLFRDINMYRTFIDQHFSRMVSAFADITINTGEDNYLTTSDAFEKAHTVLASQFINERFALNAGLPPRLIGLGHAFEIDPDLKGSFLFELAQARMVREVFPDSPIKYMPPTKHLTGDIFKGYAINTMFNLASGASGQSIHLLGMLTEAVHNPHMQDRYLAVENAKYVMNAIEGLSKEISFQKNGIIQRRARTVLQEAITFLEKVSKTGLFKAISRGMFADIKRPPKGGKGFSGVFQKAGDYWNPVETVIQNPE